MKLHIKSILAGATMLMVSSTMLAQHTNSGYFTRGYLYNHDLNPAFNGEQSYFSMPVLGYLNLGLHGNLNMQNFLYNVDGRTTTFMNPAVSAEEALRNIKDKNKLEFDTKIQILSVGFRGFGGYNTFGINARANVGLTLPGQLFRLAKEGIGNNQYDLSGLNLKANAYAEVALGHSHKIGDNLSVGAKVKVLLGGADVQAKLTKAQLNLNESGYWDVEADAEILASAKGLAFESETCDHENNPRPTIKDFNYDSPGLNGFGLAFDLGAEYKIMKGLYVSAAVTDLGFLKWNRTLAARTYKNNRVSTDAYIFNIDDESDHNFEDEMDKLVDDLGSLVDLKDEGDQGPRSKGLGSTIRLGVEYAMPFYDKLSVGLLNTTRVQSDYSWTDFRLSANIAPAKMISLGVNYGVGTYGSSFGWIFDLHPNGFNLFLAMDYTLGSVSKQFVPLKSNADITMGINFPLGRGKKNTTLH